MNASWYNRKQIIKIVMTAMIVAVLLIGLWMGGLYWLSQMIHQNRAEIQKLIDEQLGYPTTFETIETHTNIDGLCLALNNVTIKDIQKSVPIMTIKQIELHPNLLQTFFKKTLILRRIQLDGLKMRFIWDPAAEKFKLSGLQGEDITTDADYKNVIDTIPLQHSLSLKDAEIDWQGKSTHIIQNITGQFLWLSSPTKSFQFSGTQAISVNEGAFFKETPLEFTFDPATGDAHIETGLANAAIECRYNQANGFNCDVNADQLDLASLHHNFLLKEGDPAWLKWLLTALPKGYAEGYLKITGTLENADWQGELRYRKLDLQYSPKWPAIENSAGTIKIEKHAIQVEMNRGDIVGTPIDKVTATIAPLATEAPSIVMVNGLMSGDLENGMEFLKESPLQKLYKTLASLNPKGGMDLKLNLKIPLDDTPTEVVGALNVKQGHLMLAELNLPVEQINGTFDFTEKHLTTKAPLQAVFLKRPLTIEADAEGIKAATFLTTDFIQKQFRTPVLDYFNGGANVVFQLPPEETKWILKTDLKGIEIDLPAPLHKKAEENLPTTLVINRVSAKETQFALNSPKVIDAKWKQEVEKKKSKLKSGHIVLGGGNSDWTTQNTLLISGTLSELDVQAWQDFIEKKTEVSSIKIPILLHISIGHLKALGMELKQTWINYDSRKPNIWGLEGPLLKGSISLPTDQQNVLLLDLEYLNITPDENEKQNLAAKFLDKQNKIPIIFACDMLNYGSHNFGQVEFRLDPSNTGYLIQDFTAKSQDFILEGAGEWRLIDKQNATTLKGQLYSDNMGAGFQRMGFASIDGGNGRIRFEFQWNDSPFDFALKKVQGLALIQIKTGVILGVDPGLGKVVGLLSLDSIRRRLNMDFKDVMKKGFAFDTINASLKFQKGIATTDDLMIDGPAAKISLAGQTNLVTKGLNLNMRVVPKLMSSSLPIAASIATGNPAVGVGVWMVDKLTGSKLSNLAQYDYQVTGTWDSPNIQEVRRLGPNRRQHPH